MKESIASKALRSLVYVFIAVALGLFVLGLGFMTNYYQLFYNGTLFSPSKCQAKSRAIEVRTTRAISTKLEFILGGRITIRGELKRVLDALLSKTANESLIEPVGEKMLRRKKPNT